MGGPGRTQEGGHAGDQWRCPRELVCSSTCWTEGLLPGGDVAGNEEPPGERREGSSDTEGHPGGEEGRRDANGHQHFPGCGSWAPEASSGAQLSAKRRQRRVTEAEQVLRSTTNCSGPGPGRLGASHTQRKQGSDIGGSEGRRPGRKKGRSWETGRSACHWVVSRLFL